MKTFITIDPGSKSAGICLVNNGKISNSWTIESRSKCYAIRCKDIAVSINNQFKGLDVKFDAIYIEVLNNKTSYRVLWSVGAIMAALGKFCTEKTKIVDKTAKIEGKCCLVPTYWQRYFSVERYNASDSDKDDKILRAFKKNFPKMKVDSADEAVSIFLAKILLDNNI